MVNVAQEFAASLTLLTVVGPLAVILWVSTRLPVNRRFPSTSTETCLASPFGSATEGG
jgi:hypothetical protein